MRRAFNERSASSSACTPASWGAPTSWATVFLRQGFRSGIPRWRRSTIGLHHDGFEVGRELRVAVFVLPWVRQGLREGRSASCGLSADGAWKSPDFPKALQAVADLGLAVATAPVLAYFNVRAKTDLYVDASGVSIGGVLQREDENGDSRPVGYYSRRFEGRRT